MIKLKVYRVVGERKKRYFERKNAEKEKVKELNEFFKEHFPELEQELPLPRKGITFSSVRPEIWVEEGEEELIAKLTLRKDLKNRSEYYDGRNWVVFSPNRKTKVGKELEEEWKEITSKPEFHNVPEYLQVDRWSTGDPFGKSRLAFVHEENGEVILYAWSGFNPEEFEGFEPVEAVINIKEVQNETTQPAN